jgi:chromosome segregation ATPase
MAMRNALFTVWFVFRILIAFAVASLLSCAPQQKTTMAATRPPETAAVAPMAAQARADALASRETASKLEAEVETIQKTTGNLRQGIDLATAEADRLRRQKSATEKELESLWGMLTAEQNRTAQLWQQVETSKALSIQHRDQRLIAERRIIKLADAAVATDVEMATLRRDHDTMKGQIDQARKIEADLQAKLTKAEKDAAIARFLKGTAAIGTAVLVLAAVAFVAIKLR